MGKWPNLTPMSHGLINGDIGLTCVADSGNNIPKLKTDE